MKYMIVSAGSIAAVGVAALMWNRSGTTSPPVSIETVGPLPTARDTNLLSVVPVREHPPFIALEWEKGPAPSGSALSGCPVALRAVIAGDEADGFAMVDVDGDSVAVRLGETLPTSAGKATVSQLGSNYMFLKGAFGKIRCALDTER